MIFEKSLHSLTGKLILTIGTLMIAGSIFFWYFLIRHQEEELLNNSVKYGYSIVDSIKKSTRFGMLTFQQRLIQQTVEAVGSAEGVLNVRIFDSKGKIAYSSDKKDIGTVFNKNSPMCTSCHATGKQKKSIPFWSITRGKDFRILNIVQPINNEPSCYTAACHFHNQEQSVLGLVEADLSLAFLDNSIQQQAIAITIYVIAFIVIISGVLGSIFWKFVTTPLNNLAQGMKRVSSGDLDHQVIINTKDELEVLANVFNSMTTDLKKAKVELVDWGINLEKKVQEKTEMIKKTQAQLIHSEKLASLGRMATGFANEINSPVTGIVTFAHQLQKKFPAGTDERKEVEAILDQANSCSVIIQGLLGFAKASVDGKGVENINIILRNSLSIVQYKSDFLKK
jgi:two-component system NtrC family sensor kinase